MTFGKLTDLVKMQRALDANAGLKFVFLQFGARFFVVELNTYNQLFQGIDSTGQELKSIGGQYALSTIIDKARRGLPFDRVTLFDTGEFYDSFDVKVGGKSLVIQANTIKVGEDLQDRWGFELLGLTDESIETLVEFIAPKISEWLVLRLIRV